MKKAILIILGLFIITFAFNSCKNDVEYGSWKDTVESFGDGTYQVMHSVREGENIECLSNIAYNQTVITELNNYLIADKVVYFCGAYHSQPVYAVLYIEQNLLKYYVDKSNGEEFIMTYINDILDAHQMLFLNSFDDFNADEKAALTKL